MPKPTDMTPDRVWADAQELLRKRSQAPRMTQLLIGPDRLVLEFGHETVAAKVRHATPHDDLYAMLLQRLDEELRVRWKGEHGFV